MMACIAMAFAFKLGKSWQEMGLYHTHDWARDEMRDVMMSWEGLIMDW
jgi:hypothetical protein